VFQTLSEAFSVLLIVLIILLAITISYRALKLRWRASVSTNLAGGIAEAIDGLFPGADGYVFYQNKYWLARTDAPIYPKSKVSIIRREGGLLHVKPLEDINGE
jgi:membrane-bound ClpP family serine protease